jgi:ATP-dependent Lhr-like helicase
VHPLDRLASWLGGEKPSHVCVAGEAVRPRIELITPGFDAPFPSAGWAGRAMLPAIARRIATCAGTTLVFVQSRPLAEHWTQALRDVLPPRIPIACFHGSMAPDERGLVARQLVDGTLKAVVTTNSLEVGVDVPEAEQVILLQTPGSVTRFSQSAGRSHHRPGGVSLARIAPLHVLDLLAAVALRRCSDRGEIEPLALRRDDLDVAVQAVLGICALGPARFDEILSTLRRADPFRHLADRDLDAVLSHLESGGEALETQTDIHRIARDDRGSFALTNAHALRRYLRAVGTITAEPAVAVRAGGRTIGHVDGIFAARLETNDVFVLAGVPWRVLGHHPGEMQVMREKNSARRVARWAGTMPTQTATLMAEWERVHGELDVVIPADAAGDADARADAIREVATRLDLAPGTAQGVVELCLAHRRRSTIPTSDRFVVDLVTDRKRVHIVAYTFAGTRANEVIGRAIAWRWRRRTQRGAESVANDMGVMLSIDRETAGLLDDPETLRELFSPDRLEDEIQGTFEGTEFAKNQFREVARVSQLTIQDARRGAASPGLLYDVLRKHAPGHVLLRALEHTLWTALDGDHAERVLRSVRKRAWFVRTMQRPAALAIPLFVAAMRDRVAPEDLDQALVAAAHAMYLEHGATELP